MYVCALLLRAIAPFPAPNVTLGVAFELPLAAVKLPLKVYPVYVYPVFAVIFDNVPVVP